MAENSKIQWTHHTFNPWRGCTKISPGCTNCYAETLSHRNPKVLGIWGDNGTRVIASESMWKEPVRWNKAAKEVGERHRVFCASLADVFEDRPELEEPRTRLFQLIEQTPDLDWLLLTKRPQNAIRMTFDAWCKKVKGHVSQNEGDGWRWDWPRNVWVGTSVEDQQRANERIPLLLKIPAAVRFLSMEPLLGPVDIWQSMRQCFSGSGGSMQMSIRNGIDWVIVGGESGSGSRRCELPWVRYIIRQCGAAGVPVFVKQLGAAPIISLRLRDGKGGDMEEWPEEYRIREFPTRHAA